jgi:hypothetical protein
MSTRDQAAFAARIRQPQAEPLLPGVSAARMAVYEELFFNNLDGFITSGFPVLCQILGEARRQRLVREFIAGHRCATPFFLAIGEEFVAWLEVGGGAEQGDPAHGWSPLAWPLAYTWPVQRIGADYQPREAPAEPTCLLAWRDSAERVRFQQLSPFAYHLALRLQAGQPPLQALPELAEASGLEADEPFFTNARVLLDGWQQQDIWYP